MQWARSKRSRDRCAVALGAPVSASHLCSGKTVYGEKAQVIDRLREAGSDLGELMNAPDSSIREDVLESAKCVAIVPDMVKGGFVVGGRHGRGVATCRTPRAGVTQPFS